MVKFLLNNFLFCALVLSINCLGYTRTYVEEVYKMKRVEYENLPQSEYSWVGPYRYYVPENNIIMGYGYHPASGVMIAVLSRIRPGVPIALGAFCVSDYPPGSTPKLWGFPDYQTNALRASDFGYDDPEDDGRKYSKMKSNKYNHRINFYDWNQYYNGRSHHYLYQKPLYQEPQYILPPTSSEEERITTVYQVNVDEICNRVFFMDTGILFYPSSNTTYPIQKAALVVYNLPSDGCETRNFQLIRRAELPDKIANDNPVGFIYTTLDYQSNDCDDLFVYTHNFFGNYLVVYDYKRNEFWRYTNHPTFQPVSAESYFVFDKTFNFQLEAGIMSIALGYPDSNGDRTAYYITGAGTAQFSVSTSVLKNRRKSPMNYNPNDFKIMGYRGCDSQAGPMIVDYTYGVVFYAEIQSNRISCWNMNKPLNPDNIGVVYESDKVQYPLTLILDSRGYLWFDSSRLPIIYYIDQSLDLSEINMRLSRIKVSDAIRGTVCEDD